MDPSSRAPTMSLSILKKTFLLNDLWNISTLIIKYKTLFFNYSSIRLATTFFFYFGNKGKITSNKRVFHIFLIQLTSLEQPGYGNLLKTELHHYFNNWPIYNGPYQWQRFVNTFSFESQIDIGTMSPTSFGNLLIISLTRNKKTCW